MIALIFDQFGINSSQKIEKKEIKVLFDRFELSRSISEVFQSQTGT